MILDLPDTIAFELLDFQRGPLAFLLERIPHVTREALLQRIFSRGMESLMADQHEKDSIAPSELRSQAEPISPHKLQLIPAQMKVHLTRLQQLALSDLMQHQRLNNTQELMARVINTGLHSLFDAETGADPELSLEEQIELARKAKRPPVAPAFASAEFGKERRIVLTLDILQQRQLEDFLSEHPYLAEEDGISILLDIGLRYAPEEGFALDPPERKRQQGAPCRNGVQERMIMLRALLRRGA